MPKFYEIPELTVIGQAEEVIQGLSEGLGDVNSFSPEDFEFLQD